MITEEHIMSMMNDFSEPADAVALSTFLGEWNKEHEHGTCCICGKPFTHFGNNPDPIKEEGRCCDECNKSVLSERMLRRSKKLPAYAYNNTWESFRLLSYSMEQASRFTAA